MPTTHAERSAAIVDLVAKSAGVDPRVVLERGVNAGAQVVVIALLAERAEYQQLFPQADVVEFGSNDTDGLTARFPRSVLVATKATLAAMISSCHEEANAAAGLAPYEQVNAPRVVDARVATDAAADSILLRGLRGATNATLVVTDEDEREVMIALFPQVAVIPYADLEDNPKLTAAHFARGPVAFTPGALGAMMADLDTTLANAEAAGA